VADLKKGIDAFLYEMKPALFSPAHKSPLLAELVCSNSFRSNATENAVGLLKEEMRMAGSLIMEAADATAVPAGKALAVDRTLFSNYIEDRLASTGTRIIREEVTEIFEDSIVIIATGPLTSESLAKQSLPLQETSISIFMMPFHPSWKHSPSTITESSGRQDTTPAVREII